MAGALIDYERSACLCDVGAPDYAATVCVTPNGEDVLWLVDINELGEPDPRCGDADQRHERLGRLPADVRERIWASPRCGRPTRTGRPCRIKVTTPGDPCGTHAKPRCDGCGQIMHHQGGVWGCFGCHPRGRGYWAPVEAPS